MRFHGDSKSARLTRAILVLAGTTVLASCGAGSIGSSAYVPATAIPANGPQADYPVTIGAAYTVDGTQYTPADVLNYDEVGYLAAGTGEGITGSHHTLPFPSYVEVTSLETGRTILVRLEGRGPMESNHLLALSAAAMEQLGASQETPVRVRRVNPPEDQRRLLRDDLPAPLRMDSPMSLVEVLKRRLPEEGSVSLRAAAPVDTDAEQAEEPTVVAESVEAAPPVEMAETELAGSAEPFEQAFAEIEAVVDLPEDVSLGEELAAPAETAEVIVEAEPASEVVMTDGFVVQAAAFSTIERAERAAGTLGGNVSQSGRYFRVRTGPFATRDEAEASLANVRAAGYSDARIYSTG